MSDEVERPATVLRERLLGISTAVALVATYFTVLRPLRIALAHNVLYPLLASVDTARAASLSLVAVPDGPILRVLELFSTQYYVAGGLYFWAPASVLLLVAPRRPYWLVHGGLVVVLSLLGFVCFAIGYGWGSWGFTAQTFVEDYVLRPLSVGYPLFVLYRPRIGESIS